MTTDIWENILADIENGVKLYNAPDTKKILYHGFKEGISGKIVPNNPKANPQCDFGMGFYLGTDKDQAISLVCKYPTSKFYTFEIDFSSLSCAILSGMAWLYFICWNRNWFSEKAGECLSNIFSPLSELDIIIGEIADDRMEQALNEFKNMAITDTGFSLCLKSARMGIQYSLKTQKACDNIKLINKMTLSPEKRKQVNNRMFQRCAENMKTLRKIQEDHIRDGLYFPEIQKNMEKMCNDKRCDAIHLQ